MTEDGWQSPEDRWQKSEFEMWNWEKLNQLYTI
jgi:hypothetical protein